MPGAVRVEVRRALVRKLVPDNTGVFFDARFVDAFLEDDRDKIERQSNVHDWKPARGVRLFHGLQDQTVPYVGAADTPAAMRARGAADASLTDCIAVPRTTWNAYRRTGRSCSACRRRWLWTFDNL